MCIKFEISFKRKKKIQQKIAGDFIETTTVQERTPIPMR